MKKIWFRFIVCLTIGLFAFTIYLMVLFPLLLRLIQPEITIEQTYYVDGNSGPVILAFLACFLSGGFFFSLFFVQPIYHILQSINRLAQGQSLNLRIYRKNKLKAPYLLYKEVIENLRTLEQGLHQADRDRADMEAAKSEWLAGVSHDLKTPLSYISGYSSLLLTPGYSFSQDELTHHLNRIYQKSVYIKSLIDDMNLLFLIERGGRLPFCPERTELVGYLQGLVRDVADSPQALSCDFSFIAQDDEIYLDCDRKLMYRALFNLLFNCVEHNPEKTSICVTLTRSSRELMLSIEDDGRGLAEKDLAFYEESLYSPRTPGCRKGLGVYIAKTILEAHGAALEVKNLPQAGARFSITWPDRQQAA